MELQPKKQGAEPSNLIPVQPLSTASLSMMQKSLTSLRLSRAISTKEKRLKRLALLHHMLEMEGYIPNSFSMSYELALVARRVGTGKWSPEKGTEELIKLIKLGVIQYE